MSDDFEPAGTWELGDFTIRIYRFQNDRGVYTKEDHFRRGRFVCTQVVFPTPNLHPCLIEHAPVLLLDKVGLTDLLVGVRNMHKT